MSDLLRVTVTDVFAAVTWDALATRDHEEAAARFIREQALARDCERVGLWNDNHDEPVEVS